MLATGDARLGPRLLALAVALMILGISSRASGDDAPAPMPSAHLTMRGDARLTASNGQTYAIPRGSHVLAPESWVVLDVEVRRLQDAETRLSAENRSLRASASTWRPGLTMLAVAAAAGLAGGLYLGLRL